MRIMPVHRVGADFEVTHHGRRERGIVRLIGSITSTSIFEVVDRMDALVADHYNEIVLEINSSGGEVTPLWRFLWSMRNLRRQNIRLITQAYDNVSSAAAIMLSAGDVRLASFECRLLYHSGRIPNAQDITAADARRVEQLLRSSDTSVAKYLMKCTGWNEAAILAELRNDRSMDSHWAECCNFIDMVGDYRNDDDLDKAKQRSEQSYTDILAHIRSSLAPSTDPRAKDKADEAMMYAVGRLPKALGVDDPPFAWGENALVDRKIPDATMDLLREFGPDPSTACESVGESGDLALLAKLRSAVGGTKETGLQGETAAADQTTAEPQRSSLGSMRIRSFRDHIPKHGDIPQAEVTRHFLALGETGSGKTISFIQPIIEGLLSLDPRFKDNQPGQGTSAFVVDPKNELLGYITKLCLEREDMDVRKIVLTGGQKSGLRVNFDTLLVPGEGSDAQTNSLLSDPSQFELLATRIVERAASLDTTNMMNADHTNQSAALVMEARRALEAFVESLIWFRRYPKVAGSKWEEVPAETEEQNEEDPAETEEQTAQSLVDEWKEHYRFIMRVERNAILRLNRERDRGNICSEAGVSRLIVEADYCCQAQDMAIEFGEAAQRSRLKGQIVDDPEMWLLQRCGLADSFHERILQFFSGLLWVDHRSFWDGSTVSRHPIRCCDYDSLIRLLGLSRDERPFVTVGYWDIASDRDREDYGGSTDIEYEFLWASVRNFETEITEFRAAAKEWIGNFWQWWRDEGEGLVPSILMKFHPNEASGRMWEEHLRKSNRVGGEHPTAKEHKDVFFYWLADTIVLRMLALVWSIPSFQQITLGSQKGEGGNVPSDDELEKWVGAREHRWESPHYLENVFEFMPTTGWSRDVVLESLECSQRHWSVAEVEPQDDRCAVSDEIRTRVRKSFSQTRDPEVSKLLALRAKEGAIQSLSRWCMQPQVNVFTAIRDNVEPLFKPPGDKDNDGATSAHPATIRVGACLEAIAGDIMTRMGSTISVEDLVEESGAKNLASLEAGERELRHLYRLQQKLFRVGSRGTSSHWRGDALTGFFGGFLDNIAGSEAGSTVFFGVDWFEEPDREYDYENTECGHGRDQSSVDDLISNAGSVFVFCPAGSDMSEEEEFIVRAAKARLFEKCLVAERENLFEGGPGSKRKRHVVAYVADEFQRFVTVGKEHGEQTFIDRCRSYGVCCVFATQSLSSLRYRLGASSEAVHSLDIVLSNIGTKAFFRTTDREALGYLNSLLGIDLGSSKRGLPTLEVGECWLARANGSFSRRKMRLEDL